jgi:multiple sugar transport system ATP-binding protein
MDMAEVTLDKVTKIYGKRDGLPGTKKHQDVLAVNELDLTIKDGEFLALLGPSGCGKTTTLRMIVGLEAITGGEIRIGGCRVNEIEPKDRGVGLAFETYALYPPLTIRENISFCLKAKGISQSEIKKRVEEVAKSVDVTDFLDKKPGELGSGEKQRVALARALIRNPEVFLMDEPLSHLDAAHRAIMRVELKRLHTEIGTTTVLVTHDQLEAIAMADRIAVMNQGVLQQVGTPDEIYNHPANEFVADFVGEPPMNFLFCTLSAQNGDLYLKAADGSFAIKVPEIYRKKLSDFKKQQVKLGIRPLYINVFQNELPADPSRTVIQGLVYTYESLGEEGLLTIQVGNTLVMAVMPPAMDFFRDQKVWLGISNNHMHLFDTETGLTIW